MANYSKTLSVRGELESFVLEETKKLAKGVLANVVRKTPYRTGQAKRNWIVSEGNDDQEFIRVSEKAPFPASTAENFALTEGFFKLNQVKVFKLIYIQNNAPYINRLNAGYSLQAPQMFVETAILEEINKR